MIVDLGVELAEYGRKPSTFTVADLHNMKVRLWTGGGVNSVPLADLQAQGFNTTPPPGFTGPRKKYDMTWLRNVLWDEDQ